MICHGAGRHRPFRDLRPYWYRYATERRVAVSRRRTTADGVPMQRRTAPRPPGIGIGRAKSGRPGGIRSLSGAAGRVVAPPAQAQPSARDRCRRICAEQAPSGDRSASASLAGRPGSDIAPARQRP